MIPQGLKQTIDLGDGRTIEIETGKLAKQAHGSVVVRMGDTMLLATVVSNKDAKEGVNFLPLTVDYREKFAADGRFPGGFLKREARPSDQEILVMRLVDRVLRPLFPSDYHADTQLMIQLMSYDKDCMPDALAGLAASACLTLSDIPFEGPISEVRVARVDGKFIVNPNPEQLEAADMDLMVGASLDSVAMVEGEMDEVSEADMIEGIKVAHEAIKIQCNAQLALAEALKVGAKREYSHEEADDLDLLAQVKEACYDKCYAVAKSGNPDKHARKVAFGESKDEFLASLSEEDRTSKSFLLGKYIHQVEKDAVRAVVLNEGIRLDGRATSDIRPIWSEVDYLPTVHGSAVFTRGETQSLSTVTLGTALDVNRIDNVTFRGSEKFYLHYNFPPYSTGEARPIRGVSRREIGHGNLAQRALKGMIPSDNPYTIRIVSEILESNGSSSMASVCAGSLALMDAGVNIKSNVSGIAMGLITEGDKYAVLSDILGDEDHLGDMDFKVTGTKDGITACQMDIKIKGLKYEILIEALGQAKNGRLDILNKLDETINNPNDSVKAHAPKMVNREIGKDFIGLVIGPGGKNIQELQKDTETTIVINEKDEIGVIEILGVDQEKINYAIDRIKNLVFEPVIDEVYNVKVIKILDFGAVVEFVPGKEALLHVSEIAWERVNNVTDYLNIGDQIEIKYMGIDPRTKKSKISRKVLLEKNS